MTQLEFHGLFRECLNLARRQIQVRLRKDGRSRRGSWRHELFSGAQILCRVQKPPGAQGLHPRVGASVCLDLMAAGFPLPQPCQGGIWGHQSKCLVPACSPNLCQTGNSQGSYTSATGGAPTGWHRQEAALTNRPPTAIQPPTRHTIASSLRQANSQQAHPTPHLPIPGDTGRMWLPPTLLLYNHVQIAAVTPTCAPFAPPLLPLSCQVPLQGGNSPRSTWALTAYPEPPTAWTPR